MKKLKLVFNIFTVLIFIAGVSACDGSMNKNEADEKTTLEQKLDETPKGKDQEKNELKEELSTAIGKFNARIDTMEQNLKDLGNVLDEKTNNAIQRLRSQRDELQHELDEMDGISEDEWNEFKKNMKQKIQEFNKAVEEFFSEEQNNK